MFRNDAFHHFTVYLGTYLHSRALRLRYSTRRSARLGAFNALEDHAVCILYIGGWAGQPRSFRRRLREQCHTTDPNVISELSRQAKTIAPATLRQMIHC